ncbi:hypothetical protein EC991_007695 [Linnemannia zychae]|nr:hypothetical protein EC991_007695 [Linnemannia zychae]
MQRRGDSSSENLQGFRAVHKSIPLSPTAAQDAQNITHIDCHTSPDNEQDFVLWEDIQQAFEEALFVRHRSKMLTFMKGSDYRPLEPRRIPAIPGVVLDVVVGGEMSSADIARLQQGIQDISITTFQQESEVSRRHPEYGIENQALENFSYIENPAQQPQAIEHYSSDYYDNPGTFSPQDMNSHASSSTEQDQQAPTYNSTPFQSYKSNTSTKKRPPQNPQDHIAAAKGAQNDLMQIITRASQGEADAQFTLGDMFKDGRGVHQNSRTAMDWYLKAAEQGHAGAQYGIGLLYEQGNSTRQKTLTNFRWYLKGVVRGYSGAEVEIAKAEERERGIQQDDNKAFEWYFKSAEQGYKAAQFKVARWYEDGRGVETDHRKAFEWFTKADKYSYILSSTSSAYQVQR